MQFFDGSVHFIQIGMRVSRRCLNVRMSQKLLYDANIRTGFPCQGGKGMAAAVRRKTAHGRFSFPQLHKERIIITGKVPRVQQRTAFRTEKKLALVRQMVQPVGKLREQRHCA